MTKNEIIDYKIGELKAKRTIASLKLRSAQQEAKSLSYGDFYAILFLKSSGDDCVPEEKGIRDTIIKRMMELNEIEESMKKLISQVDEKIVELEKAKKQKLSNKR